MLTCKEASELVSQSLDRSLSWRERLVLRLHLIACAACTLFKHQIEFLRAAVRRGPEQSDNPLLPRLSHSARERIQDALSREKP